MRIRVCATLSSAIAAIALVGAAAAETALDENFDIDDGGFSYADDTFRATAEPNYASGAYLASGGLSGGGLSVTLGGVDATTVTDMSGGWSQGFSVVTTGPFELTFAYNLEQSADYDLGDVSQVMLSLDGTPLAGAGSDYIVEIEGDGDLGSPITTGWILATVDLGTLTAGNYTLVLGGYNSQKNGLSEETQVLVDDVRVATTVPLVLNVGDLVLVDAGLDVVMRADPATGNRDVVSGAGTRGTGVNFSFPRGVALEHDGNLVVCDENLQAVIRVDPATGNRSVVSSSAVGTGTNLTTPFDIAVDLNGDLLVTDVGLLAIVRIDPSSGNRTIVSDSVTPTGLPNFIRPSDLAFEADGNIVVADGNGTDTVIRVDPANGNRTLVSSAGMGSGPAPGDLSGILVEPDTNLVISDVTNDSLARVDPTSGNRMVISAGTGPAFTSVLAVARESDGNFLAMDNGNQTVLRVDNGTGNRVVMLSSSVGTGVDPVNLRDVIVVSGGVCGDGVLDPSEQCDDGNNDPGDCCSPTCTFESAVTVCRASADVCDVAETCTGSSGTCPADDFEPGTTECRASVDVCDVAELCTGTGPSCPADGFEPGTTECRASVDVCDVAELCTGTGVSCPADGFEPGTTECRAVADVCDVAENCTGAGVSCPADGFEPPTTECRASTDVCDPAENCTGSGISCPADVLLDGVPCLDGDVCNGDENCVVGVCTPGTPLDCDDGDVCTADGCDGITGCFNTPIVPCGAEIPAISEWGVMLLVLLITAAGALLLHDQRRRQA